MYNSIRESTSLGCFSLLRRSSPQDLSYRYRRLTDDTADTGTVTIVVGKEKRVFHVDQYVLDTYPFKCLLELAKANGNKREICGSDCKGVIFLDLDAILFEHMLWLVSEECSTSTFDSTLMLDMREIVDFYSQDI
ncbi:hypothetical protein LUZ62_044837 [Rhynchospora pubera]|uniref:BTB domain-containing protein n=1 Tax=Rhynchospora pubera TaxID=906938 RepID=A0AAV8CDH7_9POAL|nr:hypothetical protein LUZ62_087816 [Rhynchospora pubera]KAJ4764709.1 hypothetical protein LUZ62_075084 [Rhynchospora pubera]KAJ4793591.1 hypothetical protein LUZ62_044837 [Rhynchospora pubera]